MSNENQHIPSGYKPSPLGIIPEDWEVKRLGDIAEITSGTTPSRENSSFYSNGTIPWVKTTDLNNGILNKTEELVTEKAIDKTSLKILPSGTVLVAMYGGFNQIGRTALLGMNATVNQALSALVCKQEAFNHYVLAWLNYHVGDWKRLAASSRKDPNITGKDVERFPILVPKIEEQQRIVSVLSLWDTAITKQTALIEKLTLRKRGLMQQLLTGNKRLKGFEREWKEVRLGDVASINRGGSPRPIENYITKGEGYNWIKIGDVGQDAKYITCTEEKIIKEGLSKTRYVKSGDFILSNSMSFGRPYILKIDGCIHDGWLVIQEYAQTFNIDFLYYILGYDTTLAQYKSMAAGSGVLNLNKEIVKEVQLKIPSIEEQIAIASILVNADNEIEIQKQKLSDLQEQKRGLMQVLLTGKRRVK